MAIIQGEINQSTIDMLKGIIDFYYWKGKILVARAWPKYKFIPPTMKQSIYQNTFKEVNKLLPTLKSSVVDSFYTLSLNSNLSWKDLFFSFALKFSNQNSLFKPITDFETLSLPTKLIISCQAPISLDLYFHYNLDTFPNFHHSFTWYFINEFKRGINVRLKKKLFESYTNVVKLDYDFITNKFVKIINIPPVPLFLTGTILSSNSIQDVYKSRIGIFTRTLP